MYHPTVVSRNIESALKRGVIKSPPAYHSRSVIESNIKHLKAIYDSETGTWTRELVRDEIEFIRNERFLCRVDFKHFSECFCWIKTREDLPIRFSPWVSQAILIDIFAENELEGIGIELQSLKARQLGVSRIISLAQLHRVAFYSHINAVLASSTPTKTGKLADMMEFTINYLPHWLIPAFSGGPRESALRSGGEWFELETGASISLQAGSQVSGIARGTTPTVVHISELAEFESRGLGPTELIDSSLFKAVHPGPRIFMVLESTALGMNNWWHTKWISSTTGWPERRARLRPVFLPWFVGSKKLGYVYPEQGFLDRSPVPSNYDPAPWVLDHAAKAADFVANNELLRRYMGPDWRMPIQQMWFYEIEKQQAINEDRLNTWMAEMPASPEEAFQSTNISIFSTDTVQAHREHTRCPVGVYGLFSPEMAHNTILFSERMIDRKKEIVDIYYEWGQEPKHYQLVPLRYDNYALDTKGLDKIFIWEWPEEGQIYGIGGDTSDGIGKDRSVLEILRKGSPWQVAAQCAEFATDKLNALDLISYAKALAALYSVKTSEFNDAFRRQCRVAIECKGKGDLTQLGLKLDGWRNFHPWIRPDNKKLDLSNYNKEGIFTTEWFRLSIQEYLMKMCRNLEIEIRSKWLVDEMQSLETDSVNQSFRATHGGHDDRAMSLGFIIISLYQWEPNRPVASMQPTRQSILAAQSVGKAIPKQYARYTPSAQEKLGVLDA